LKVLSTFVFPINKNKSPHNRWWHYLLLSFTDKVDIRVFCLQGKKVRNCFQDIHTAKHRWHCCDVNGSKYKQSSKSSQYHKLNFNYDPGTNFYLLTVLRTQGKSANERSLTNCGTVEGRDITAKAGTYYGSERRFCTFTSCCSSIWGKNLNRKLRISNFFTIIFVLMKQNNTTYGDWILFHFIFKKQNNWILFHYHYVNTVAHREFSGILRVVGFNTTLFFLVVTLCF